MSLPRSPVENNLLSSIRGPDRGYLGHTSDLSEMSSDIRISFRPSSSATPHRMRMFFLGGRKKQRSTSLSESEGLLDSQRPRDNVVMNLSRTILGM